jgi:hypothetical protein
MKKASKLCNPSLLAMRIKPDWEVACPLLERAALCYKVPGSENITGDGRRCCPARPSAPPPLPPHACSRAQPSPAQQPRHPRRAPAPRELPADQCCALVPQQAGAMEKALHAYERAATAQEKQGSQWHAAKHMETAGEICKQLQQWQQLGDFYQRAAQLYQDAGRASTGARRGGAAPQPAAGSGGQRCSGPRAAAHRRCPRRCPPQALTRWPGRPGRWRTRSPRCRTTCTCRCAPAPVPARVEGASERSSRHWPGTACRGRAGQAAAGKGAGGAAGPAGSGQAAAPGRSARRGLALSRPWQATRDEGADSCPRRPALPLLTGPRPPPPPPPPGHRDVRGGREGGAGGRRVQGLHLQPVQAAELGRGGHAAAAVWRRVRQDQGGVHAEQVLPWWVCVGGGAAGKHAPAASLPPGCWPAARLRRRLAGPGGCGAERASGAGQGWAGVGRGGQAEP